MFTRTILPRTNFCNGRQRRTPQPQHFIYVTVTAKQKNDSAEINLRNLCNNCGENFFCGE
ncbi:hypothetical protein EV194_1292 [Natronoflexus pectinivorans]|uniref:Uncharacterized protein n=1 Tax=Natronoflexus pectinivorans TaxID=682526 RepID=A0A4R2G3Z0_9BACT|nr:hypothetical protein EV194_1292 [Natronoflexus pectinivorans]